MDVVKEHKQSTGVREQDARDRVSWSEQPIGEEQ